MRVKKVSLHRGSSGSATIATERWTSISRRIIPPIAPGVRRVAKSAGKRVLDFAAGCGIGAIAAALAGAAAVEAAEIDDMALAATRLNAALNGVAVATPPGDVVGSACRWDLILAGDVCYEAPMTAHILPWLRAMAGAGAEVWIADPGRAYLPVAGMTLLSRHRVPTTRELEDREERQVTIHRLLP
ncbi:MAG: hypothetical protein B7Z53_03755 [Rhodospirillales bacterium 12-71-4]|nr:MAG: hypothetical protein B7Z53_03755 [Rhodospirillales bacterium 12-71-4]